jgi:hypothetical protein
MSPDRRGLALLALATLTLAAPGASQVGYPTASSPFRSITSSRWIEGWSGRILGNGGPLLVGPRDGIIYGARIDFRARNALQLSIGGWYANTVRYVVDAYDSVAKRVSGPVPQRLYAGEATFQFNMTGGKSWHGLAPYAAVGFGLVHGARSPAADTSGYSFGNRLFFAPSLGTRVMVGDHLFLRLEGRAHFWSLRYPPSYSLEPVQQPGTVDHPNRVNTTGKASQYVATPGLLIGIGIAW